MGISSLRAAYKICDLSDWTINNMRLQKILYLINMVYVGRHDKPLIFEHFEAWEHGPVLPILYNKVKRFGIDPIKRYVFESDLKTINDEEITQVLTNGWEKLCYKENWELIGLTRRVNGAWEKRYVAGKKEVITLEDLKQDCDECVQSPTTS